MAWESAPRPLRDEGLLESALKRPQMAAYYEGADIIRQATLLGTGISQAQAFLDGNKRTAFQTLDAFLWVNGWEYVGDPLDLARQFEQFAERSMRLMRQSTLSRRGCANTSSVAPTIARTRSNDVRERAG